MANTIKTARGLKAAMPALPDGQIYFCKDTGELFIGNSGNKPLVIAGTTDAPGMVKLNDSVDSTSVYEAATANAVRTAYEAAVAASGGGTTFESLFERKNTNVSTVYNANGSISETLTDKTSGKTVAARQTTFTSTAVTEAVTFYKENGTTVDYSLTRTTTFNTNGSVSINIV